MRLWKGRYYAGNWFHWRLLRWPGFSSLASFLPGVLTREFRSCEGWRESFCYQANILVFFSYFCDRTLFDWLDDRLTEVFLLCYKFHSKFFHQNWLPFSPEIQNSFPKSIVQIIFLSRSFGPRFKKLLWNCCSMSNIINPFLYSMYDYGPSIISFNSWRFVHRQK